MPDRLGMVANLIVPGARTQYFSDLAGLVRRDNCGIEKRCGMVRFGVAIMSTLALTSGAGAAISSSVVAYERQAVSVIPGQFYQTVDRPTMSPSGIVTFQGILQPARDDNGQRRVGERFRFVTTGSPSARSTVARQGDPVPGIAGATHTGFNNLLQGGTGHIAFRG